MSDANREASEKLIAHCDERKEIAPLDDGYLYYWPSGTGAIASWELRVIADELDKRNEPWDREVQEALKELNRRPPAEAEDAF